MLTSIVLAWRLLWHRKLQVGLSQLRLCLVVLVMFSQLGFMNSIGDSQTHFLERFDAQLMILSANRHNLFIDEEFPRDRLAQAATVPGVIDVWAVYLEDAAMWKNPQTGIDFPVRCFAFNPHDQLFRDLEIKQALVTLRQPDTLLIDRNSRSHIGSASGDGSELNGRRCQVTGRFQLGPDFRYDCTVLTSDTNFFRYFPSRRPDRVAYGLIHLAPGADPLHVLRQLQQVLPTDVEVLTIAAVKEREQRFWSQNTPVGLMFGFGLLVGFVIGLLTCYQVLHAEIDQHRSQFAALKALGFTDQFLIQVVVVMALILAAAAFVPALVLAGQLYAWLGSVAGLHLQLPASRSAWVAGLTVCMCVLSAALSSRELRHTDPVEVFE